MNGFFKKMKKKRKIATETCVHRDLCAVLCALRSTKDMHFYSASVKNSTGVKFRISS